jgi:hypothetical protein
MILHEILRDNMGAGSQDAREKRLTLERQLVTSDERAN